MSRRAVPAEIRAVLLDIEGTTTPITYVVDVLFPFARQHLRRHIEQHAASMEYAELFDQLHAARAADQAAGEIVPLWVDEPLVARLESVADYVEWLMDRDRKVAPLKTLQGKIWEEGYVRGELVSAVFADVPMAFRRWRAAGMEIGIFSSGSIFAQQLLFRYSSEGDLTSFLRWHFDTTSGAKADVDSYRRIAVAMAMPAEAIVFVSDITRELDAARTAGMQTRLSIRPGNVPPPSSTEHTAIQSFDEMPEI